MSWFHRATTYRGSPTMESVREYIPDEFLGEDPTSIYQSRDFPHVFLGGASMSDLQEASARAGVGPEDFIRFNVAAHDTQDLDQYLPPAYYSAKLPEATSGTGGLMEEDMYLAAQQEFNDTADALAQTIVSTDRPIYVHCAMGVNRSASVLAAALTKITDRSVTDILREMKGQRFLIAPHDAYFMMAVEYSKNEADEWKQQIQQRLDLDRSFDLAREKTTIPIKQQPSFSVDPSEEKIPLVATKQNRWSVHFAAKPMALPWSMPDDYSWDFSGVQNLDALMTEETAQKERELREPEFLGAGATSAAGELPNGHVVKYTDDWKEATLAQYIMKNPSPCFPQVFNVDMIQQEEPLYFIEMEKIEVLSSEEEHVVSMWLDYRREGQLEELEKFEQRRPRAAYLFNGIREFEKCAIASGVGVGDLHAGNIGWRDDQIVLFDLGESWIEQKVASKRASLEDFIQEHQQGPLEREDYASAWVPIKHPRGKPGIEFVPYPNSKGAGIFRWNDEEGIGRGILGIDDQGRVTDMAVEKAYRGQGVMQQLLEAARTSGQWQYPEFVGEATPAGLRSLHRYLQKTGPGDQ